MVEQPAADVRADHAERGAVDVGLADLPGGERGVQLLGGEVDRPVQLLVEAGLQGGGRGVHRAEVGHHIAVQPEVALETGLQQRVLAGVDAVDLVVRAHHALGLALLQGDPVRQLVDLLQRARVDVGGTGLPVGLLLVGHVVLEVGQDGLVVTALDTARHGAGQDAVDHRVLAEVFRRPPGQRGASAAHAGAEDDVLALVEGFAAHRPALVVRGVGVEAGRQGDLGREGGDPLDGPHALRPVGVDDGGRAGQLGGVRHPAERGLGGAVGGLFDQPAVLLVRAADRQQCLGPGVGGLVGVHPRDGGALRVGGPGRGGGGREGEQHGGGDAGRRAADGGAAG